VVVNEGDNVSASLRTILYLIIPVRVIVIGFAALFNLARNEPFHSALKLRYAGRVRGEGVPRIATYANNLGSHLEGIAICMFHGIPLVDPISR
jgi:cobalamin biosynthesis protein CobD/CbiB